MRVVVIANPQAGPQADSPAHQAAIRLLQRHGAQVDRRLTAGPGAAVQMAREAAGSADVVIAAGGDGTVHEAACGLVGTGCPLGVFPAGSGNDFAIGLGITDPVTGAVAVLAGREYAVDACRIDDQYFFNSVGLLGSGLVSARARRIWRRLRRWRYVLAGTGTILGYRGQRLRWSIPQPEKDALIEGRFLLVEICNGPLTGGGFRFAPDADFGDGLLDACLIRRLNVLTALRLLPTAAAGRPLRHRAVSLIRGAQMTFTCDEPVAYHRDGEPGLLPPGSHRLQVTDRTLLVRRPLRQDDP